MTFSGEKFEKFKRFQSRMTYSRFGPLGKGSHWHQSENVDSVLERLGRGEFDPTKCFSPGMFHDNALA